VILLVVYLVLDARSFAKEDPASRDTAAADARRIPFRVQGGANLALLGGVVLAVWGGGALALDPTWKARSVTLPGGLELGVVDLMRDAALLVLGLLSLKLTSKEIRARNDFSWGAIAEVAKLFAGIFIAMIPAMAILAAGKDGALAGIVRRRERPGPLLSATGALSSFLDNAPTYVVFFETARATPVAEFVARGVPNIPVSSDISIPENILSAIAAGAVFMGANTYIGNGLNFMVKSMAQEHGVKMPSFFGYMAWSCAILVPIFIAMTFLFFV
jgi:Na+/H+ antiporter NhaD/arsenite permease-like protein